MDSRLADLMKERILLFDGAMGTLIQSFDLSAEDFGGAQYEGCNEYLCLTRPELIQSIHEQYLDAGSDVIETNSFGSTPLVLAEYGLGHRAMELSRKAAELAVAAAARYSTTEWPRFVAGAMGPTTKSLSVTGGATFDELAQAYAVQAQGLIEGGVDLLVLETSQDLLNVKAASVGIQAAFEQTDKEVPVVISGTIEPMGTTLAGQTIEAFYLSVAHLKPLAVGLNCATGPEFMRDHVRALSDLAECGVSCYPNAGMPDEEGNYHETPNSFSAKLEDFANHGWLNFVGGCCGTTPEHIEKLRRSMTGKRARVPVNFGKAAVSGLEPLVLEEDNRPVIVGERTNVIGSRKFRRLIADDEFDTAAEIARAQVKAGAQVIDICVADPDRDESRDMERFMQHVTKRVKVPLMIDSTDASVAELALKYAQGKSILNSTNLEDGEARFFRFARLAMQYGTALVVGTIDETGMAVTCERKVEVAERSVRLLRQLGFAEEDIIFDPLTFPVGTGDANYLGAAEETVAAIAEIKKRFPKCSTILGVSNVSFGLPPAGREVLNAVFLYHATKAGLDYAIVNSEKLQRFASISEDERALSQRILFETSDEIVQEFTGFYREKKTERVTPVNSLPVEERLSRYVVDGSKEGLLEDLTEMLHRLKPLEIINGPLMTGMNEVGRLFNDNELIVAEVLQSAEVMKAAVAFLEPKMEHSETSNKGTVLLATVKGDVHDIGKNLVDIILSNNGFQVQNLGIKVAPEQLIEAIRTYRPNLVGLSGLLVKSAQQMVVTAEELSHADIDIPVLVGGAALTKKFTLNKIAPKYHDQVFYAKDAMDGLAIANQVIREDGRKALVEKNRQQKQEWDSASDKKSVAEPIVPGAQRISDIDRNAPVFTPPDVERHILRDYPVSELRPYLNLQMLLGKHLGVRGNVEKLLASGDDKATELLDLVNRLIDDFSKSSLRAHAVYRFFPAQSEGDRLLIYHPEDSDTVLQTFEFIRQAKPPYLCLSDFVRPKSSGVMDYVAMMAVTVGTGIRFEANALKDAGKYLESHTLQATALELAEAFAERLHRVLRDRWGFPDASDMTMRERFIAKYQGIRVSFGYPACPDLADQSKLFQLLRPEEIGVELTDGYMMDPEASVSALVFSHPEARYFNVDSSDE
ncbi:methionine synthase [Alicyclobacillus sp. SO9]|uniref:methionine synthase n=1 Tax=Alicyclobacillus sp. SO9 TaxID=2665646 RepID=UPI0018E8199A|nr:methionine synthase [Alicyclobacillus sp. SO9]QQE80986.1 methionine synthase [Alicyclobacillus sp. SO9]